MWVHAMADNAQPGNGHGRLDRLEGLMALLIDDHVQFQQEHKQLLTAQVVLTDRLDRLTDRVDRLTQTVQELAEAQAEARKSTDEKLDALIHIVDDLIRKRPPQLPS
jgi:cell division septum initiation protein DivIVA